MAIPAAADIREFLNGYCITETEIPDAWIEQRRDRMVIPYIERVTGHTISAVSEIEEFYSGTGSSILILNRRPVIRVTNISYTNIPTEVLTGNLLVSVRLIREEGILKSVANFNEGNFDPIFYKGINNIRVTYEYGYADTPEDLCEAVTMMVAKRVLNHVGARTGGGGISTDGYNRNFGARGKWTDVINEWDKDTYAILQKYITGVVGA